MCSGTGLHNDAAKAKMLAGIFRRKTKNLQDKLALVPDILSYFLVNFKNANHRCPGGAEHVLSPF